MASISYIEAKKETFSDEFFARMFLSLDFPFENTKEKKQIFMFEIKKIIFEFYKDIGDGANYTQKLGEMARGDGLRAFHYVIIRDCFLKTMKTQMGVAYTPTIKSSWEDITIIIIQILCTKVLENPFSHLWN